jgi:hypothetical protein
VVASTKGHVPLRTPQLPGPLLSVDLSFLSATKINEPTENLLPPFYEFSFILESYGETQGCVA